jgi:hypothetical protein
MSRILLVALLLFCSLASYARKAAPLPESMFGVKLGSIHKLPDSNDPKVVGTLPIREWKGLAPSMMGIGFSLYFRPLKDYKAFPYIEQREKPEDKFSVTSFSLYLLPKFPQDALNLDEKTLRASIKWEVAAIEWFTKDANKKRSNNAYYWAMDYCKTLTVDLARKPKTDDWDNPKQFSCELEEDDRRLFVGNLGDLKIYRLSYSSSVFKNKNKALDTIIRKLQMKRIGPFK